MILTILALVMPEVVAPILAAQTSTAPWFDPQTLASSAVVGAIVAGIFLLAGKRSDRRARQDVTPPDENDRIRLGNEFLTGLLKEAREERSELRMTISALETDGGVRRERLLALEGILARKDAQIYSLESRAENAAQKLREGLALTLEDILGPNHRFLAELSAGLEDTVNSN